MARSSIGAAIRARLQSDAALYVELGDRIHRQVCRVEAETTPYLVFAIQKSISEDSHEDRSGTFDCMVRFELYHENLNEAESVLDLVEARLYAATSTHEGVQVHPAAETQWADVPWDQESELYGTALTARFYCIDTSRQD